MHTEGVVCFDTYMMFTRRRVFYNCRKRRERVIVMRNFSPSK